MLAKVRGKNAQIIEHKYLTDIYDKKDMPFTVITKESWGKNLKDGIPGMLEGTEKNRMLFENMPDVLRKKKKRLSLVEECFMREATGSSRSSKGCYDPCRKICR